MRLAIALLLTTIVALLAPEARSEYPPQFLMEWGEMTSGQLYHPEGVAVDGAGNLYVVDRLNNRIQKFDSAGNFLLEWGSPGYGVGKFWQPKGIAVGPGPTFDIYVTDQARVQKFDPNGTLLGSWNTYGNPSGIAVDASNGNVYVSDWADDRILKYDSSGQFLTQWGSLGSGDGQFDVPYGIAVDPDGNVYVADEANHRIQKFNGNGGFLDKWGSVGTAHGQFDHPVGVVVDADSVYVVDRDRIQKFDQNGNFSASSSYWSDTNAYFRGIALAAECAVYVTDEWNSCVYKFLCTGKGQLLTTIGVPLTDGQFQYPVGTACSSSGEIYVSDLGRHKVQKFSENGNFILAWEINWPGDICVDAVGDVYVVNADSQRIEKFTAAGVPILQWGSLGSAEGEFDFAPGNLNGIAVDDNGDVYVADANNDRVQKFTSTGTFLASWGTTGSGPGQFSLPIDVAVDPSGDVYVTEHSNRRVQKFDDQGNFLREWGSFGIGDGQFLAPEGIESDASGAIYVADRDGHRIQKFSDNGEFLVAWGGFGAGPGEFINPVDVAIDAKGNFFVSDWSNHRIQKFGYDLEPRLLAITDVGNDQGRWVRVVCQRSNRDAVGSSTPILQYETFRRIDAVAAVKRPLQPPAGPAAELAAGDMVSDPSILLTGWDYVGSIPAHGESEYSWIVPTLADSTITDGMNWSVFFVRAATANPLVFFDSPADSGYSVDNLAPQAPLGFALAGVVAAGVQLAWNPSADADFRYFSLYRGADAGFQPGPENRIAQLTGTSFTHEGGNAGTGYYKLGVTDYAGNESGFATIQLTTSDAEGGVRIDRFAARLLSPNPARGRVVVEYDLPSTMPVSLAVFDVAGRLVERIEHREGIPAGRHSWVWSVRDVNGTRLAAGVYFVKVGTPRHSAVLKTLVVK